MLYTPTPRTSYRPLRLRLNGVNLRGTLSIPSEPRALVVIPNGSGDSIYAPSNEHVASHLRDHGFATLDVDLLSTEEARTDAETSELRFDLPLIAQRLLDVSEWANNEPGMRGLNHGYFAAGLTAATALIAAAERPFRLRAVVCRGARTDLALGVLGLVRAPTLLLAGERDSAHLQANRSAIAALPFSSRLEVISGGGHLLDDQWAVEFVAERAGEWFGRTLTRAPAAAPDLLAV